MTIPVEAVVYDKGAYYAYLYDSEDQTVKRQSISVGILDDTNYEITKGLKEGDKVVKSPDPAMEDGTEIAEKTA